MKAALNLTKLHSCIWGIISLPLQSPTPSLAPTRLRPISNRYAALAAPITTISLPTITLITSSQPSPQTSP